MSDEWRSCSIFALVCSLQRMMPGGKHFSGIEQRLKRFEHGSRHQTRAVCCLIDGIVPCENICVRALQLTQSELIHGSKFLYL